MTLYGAVVSSPTFAPSTKNSTLVIAFSASVASAVNVTWPAGTAAFSAGAVIFTVGRVSGERPLPLTSRKLSRKFAVPLNTRNRLIEDLSVGAGTVTSAQRLTLPVTARWPCRAARPSGSRRSSIEPPAVAATRNVIESIPVKLTGS